MSQALDHADLIRTRLMSAPANGELATPLDITGVPVIVDRQKDIAAEVTKAVSKTKGTAVVILWTGWKVADKNTRTPRLAHTYKISVVSNPVLAGGALAADEIMQSILLRLWHWRPTGGHVHGELEVGNGDLVPNDSFLIYECDVVIPTSL